MDADQADGAGIVDVAEDFDDLGGAQAVAGGGERFGEDDLAVFGAGGFAGGDAPFGFGAAVRGDEAVRGTEDAEDAGGRVRKALEGAAFVFVAADGLEFGQHALAGGERRLAAAFACHQDERGWAVALPGDGAGDGVAVRIGSGDLDDHGVRQAAGGGRSACGRLGRCRRCRRGRAGGPAGRIVGRRRS